MTLQKIWLVFKREYIARVSDKLFWLITLLAPIAILAVGLIPTAVALFGTEKQNILIDDQSGYFGQSFVATPNLSFRLESFPDLGSAKQAASKDGFTGLLYIPKFELQDLEKSDLNNINIAFYSKNPLSLEVKSTLTQQINKELVKRKLILSNLDPNFQKELDQSVNIKSVIVSPDGEKVGSTDLGTAIGYISGMIVYIVLLMYGSLVMQGVLEEKNSRVVEILISSIKPFELMMGKILGIALVGLTQFMVWIAIVITGSTLTSLFLAPIIAQRLPIQNISNMSNSTSNTNLNLIDINLVEAGIGINFYLVLICFLIYFFGGYLLYASLFAAIGSAINNEREGSALILPVTMPIIISFLMLFSVTQNPHGNLAIWGSMIPFTSPIIMMSRIPFDVPWWQLVLSIVLLYSGFGLCTFLAAKIYRVGILSYGNKPSYGDIWNWIWR